MEKALLISHQALPLCFPNPPVGCVIVQKNIIVADGYTQALGQGHAEAIALARFHGDLGQCDVYVTLEHTLEPCSFFGRTPSCATALALRKPRKVYVGILDPDPRNQGAGIAILRNAGIEVEVGILADRVEGWIKPYLSSTIE